MITEAEPAPAPAHPLVMRRDGSEHKEKMVEVVVEKNEVGGDKKSDGESSGVSQRFGCNVSVAKSGEANASSQASTCLMM